LIILVFEHMSNDRQSRLRFKSVNHSTELLLNCTETAVADTLSNTQLLFSDVNIGSYPQWSNNYSKVSIKMDGSNIERVNQCKMHLEENIPHENIVDELRDPMSANGNDVYQLAQEQSPFGAKLRHAISVTERALTEYTEDEVSIAFNGGKDCTAVLHLLYAVMRRTKRTTAIKSIFIESAAKDEIFPESNEFLEQSHQRYNIRVCQTTGTIKDALGQIKTDHPEIKAILMGTRVDDPHGKYVDDFTLTDTDKGWPEFMRINPILNWTYGDVWHFIRALHLPYCILYDRGYTSLGARTTTVPNPALRVTDEKGQVTYQPAYMLDLDGHERSGRH